MMRATASNALLKVEDLRLRFRVRGAAPFWRSANTWLTAVDGVSFSVEAGETLGLVGESGSGKSSTARAIMQLHKAVSGRLSFRGKDLTALSGSELRHSRRQIQMVFQDPMSSLNPRMSVAQIIAEPMDIHRLAKGRRERQQRVASLLELVGLDPQYARRYPHEFSGGQRQRIGIARALAADPSLIICDESVSALDVSIQAQIINLLQDLQERLGVAIIFIAHDLAVVKHISHRVAVMYLGRIVELAPRDEIFAAPKHPYTRSLLKAVPIPDPQLQRTRPAERSSGEIPSPIDLPSGCSFRTRCPIARPLCAEVKPTFEEIAPGRHVACHFSHQA